MYKTIIPVALAITLSACGGGSSGGTPDETDGSTTAGTTNGTDGTGTDDGATATGSTDASSLTAGDSGMSQTQSFMVDAKSNIYLADLVEIPVLDSGAGEIPPSHSISSPSGKILTLVSATGGISCCSHRPATDSPDGRVATGGAMIVPFMGLSGISYAGRGMFLTAVFTSERDVTSAPPESLDYSDVDPNTVVEYFPQINQVFFVGDGKTVDGSTQSFYVPEGATKVHFGTVDGSNFAGISNHFDDNHGAFEISIRVE